MSKSLAPSSKYVAATPCTSWPPGRVARERHNGRYWHHAVEPATGARQRSTRDAWDAIEAQPPGMPRRAAT